MDHPLRRPEEILAYRSLKQIIATKPRSLWTVGPSDNALTAMRLMGEKNIGLAPAHKGGQPHMIGDPVEAIRAFETECLQTLFMVKE